MAKNKKSGKTPLFFRFLNAVEAVGNRLPHPITLFFIFCIAIVIISAVCEALGVSATGELVNSATGMLEPTTVNAVSLANADGAVYMLT